jgi:hypothetical protein
MYSRFLLDQYRKSGTRVLRSSGPNHSKSCCVLRHDSSCILSSQLDVFNFPVLNLKKGASYGAYDETTMTDMSLFQTKYEVKINHIL